MPTLVECSGMKTHATMNGQFYHDTVSVALRSIGPAAVPGLRRVSDLLDSALLKGSDDTDMVLRQRVKRALAECQESSHVDMPSRLTEEFPSLYARLRILVDQNDSRIKERLRTLRSFVEHGSLEKLLRPSRSEAVMKPTTLVLRRVCVASANHSV